MLWRRLVQQELGVADHYIERYLEALEGCDWQTVDTAAVLSERPTLPVDQLNGVVYPENSVEDKLE
jgi:hypothetical protein